MSDHRDETLTSRISTRCQAKYDQFIRQLEQGVKENHKSITIKGEELTAHNSINTFEIYWNNNIDYDEKKAIEAFIQYANIEEHTVIDEVKWAYSGPFTHTIWKEVEVRFQGMIR